MSKKIWMRMVISLALMVLVAGLNVRAQSVLTGDWSASLSNTRSKGTDAERNDSSGKLHLNFERRTERGGRNQMGQSYDFAELQCLSREQVLGGGPVNFSLVREAGRIDCEGSFQNGNGSGTFRFTGNQSFVSAMRSRGFDFQESSIARDGRQSEEDRLFAATTLNVTTALADDLSSAGFGKLHVDDLFKAAIFKVDSKFMREMKATGFPNLDMEDLVKARIFEIDADYVRQVSQWVLIKNPLRASSKCGFSKLRLSLSLKLATKG